MEAITDGVRIGQYVIKGKVGAGTMGVVYAAEQSSMKRLVAIKFLPEEATQLGAVRRFRREARMIARLEHPYVLPVYDFGHYEGSPYIVMRYMTGGTLLDQMARGMSAASALRVLEQLARALDYAHRQGIIHRDLKPTNIFMDERGNAYLADFGLAKTLAGTEDLTTTAEGFAGTPLYISPEQAGGEKLDHQTDIYSLAVIAFEMLSGRLPYEDETPLGIIMKHIMAPVPSISQIAPALPPQVDAVFEWALAKDPASRPPTAGAFYDALRLALLGTAVDADAETLRPGLDDGSNGTLARATMPGLTRPGPAGPVTAPVERREARAWLAARRWWGAGLAAALLLLAALLWARVTVLAPGGALSAIKVYSYPVGESPRSLLYDGESIWVATTWEHRLVRLAAGDCNGAATACGQALASYPAPQAPLDVALAGGAIWVIGGLGDALVQLDAERGEVSQHDLPRPPSQLLSAHGFIWVSHSLAGLVSQFAPDGTPVRQYEAGQSPRKMAADETGVWVADEGDNTLHRLDPTTGQVGPILPLPGQPLALAYADGFLWAALAGDEVVKVNPAGGAIEARLPTGREPAALLFDGSRLWVANREDDTVMAIDVAGERAGHTIRVGDAPSALAWSPCGPSCGDLWVANDGDGTVSRVRLP